MTTQYVMKVSKKGQVVIPADIRKKMGVRKKVVFKEEGGKVIIEPVTSMEDAFGSGGIVMYKVAKEISEERRKEVEVEKAKIPL